MHALTIVAVIDDVVGALRGVRRGAIKKKKKKKKKKKEKKKKKKKKKKKEKQGEIYLSRCSGERAVAEHVSWTLVGLL